MRVDKVFHSYVFLFFFKIEPQNDFEFQMNRLNVG
jgi:hypothetical protein